MSAIRRLAWRAAFVPYLACYAIVGYGLGFVAWVLLYNALVEDRIKPHEWLDWIGFGWLGLCALAGGAFAWFTRRNGIVHLSLAALGVVHTIAAVVVAFRMFEQSPQTEGWGGLSLALWGVLYLMAATITVVVTVGALSGCWIAYGRTWAFRGSEKSALPEPRSAITNVQRD